MNSDRPWARSLGWPIEVGDRTQLAQGGVVEGKASPDLAAARVSSALADPDAGRYWLWVSRALRGLGLAVFAFLTFWATLQAHHSDAEPRWLRPSAPFTAAGALLIWALALASWYFVRRGRARPVAVVVVASSAALALAMSAPPLARCTVSGDGSSRQDLILTPIWRSMIIFVGTSPDVYESEGICAGGTPLAVQLARFLALVAVFGTAAALGVNLANRQLTRIRARWSSFDDVVVGLGDDAITVVRELVQWQAAPDGDATKRPNRRHSTAARILALYTEEQAFNEAQARALGVLTAQYDRERMGVDGGIGRRLTSYLTRRGRVAVDRVWVFDTDPFTAVDIADSAFTTLMSAVPRVKGRVPKIWVVLQERQLADDIRVRWLSRDAGFVERAPIRSPVCPAETTSMELIGRVGMQFRSADYELVICGDSDLSESLLVELATRLWEEADLRAAWNKHCISANNECDCPKKHDPQNQVAELPNSEDDLLVGGRMPTRVLVLAPTAKALLGQVRASLPRVLSRHLDIVRACELDWRALTKDGWPGTDGLPSAVIMAEQVGSGDSHLGQRLIGLSPEGSVVWMPSACPGRVYPQAARELALPKHPIQEYAKNLFMSGHVPEDAWTRIARHQHERYRRVNYSLDKRATRLAWWGPAGFSLADGTRDDNLASVRGTLAWFASRGFVWRRVNSDTPLPDPPLPAPPFGISDAQWRELLFAEYCRYTKAHDDKLPADGVMPAEDLKLTADTIVTILQILQVNGYEPVRGVGAGTQP